MTASTLAYVGGGVALDVARSLKMAFFMFLDTFWALVLGFGLSGAVQRFASRAAMQERLGSHRPAAVLRAAIYGSASSSCSYAASAMAKSLYQKGADFVTAMVFMVASTNLVVELGIVLVVLIGWQFMAAEFVGGAIMIVLLASGGALVLRGRALAEASAKVGTVPFDDRLSAATPQSPRTRSYRSLAAWSDAASYTMADFTMLRRELFIGYGVAGFLAALVPSHVWNDVFLHGHGFATSLENVVVGPFIAMVSFVCSIGNVPLAAALWNGGISFGGVVSFIFGDLIAMPILLVYRRLYGSRMALRLLGVLWATMTLAGLATEGIFRAIGIVPTTYRHAIVSEHLGWTYTNVLNVAFLFVFAGLVVLARSQCRLGGGIGYATDPVCGMRVETANAPAICSYRGGTYYFCSDHCRHQFVEDPEQFVARGARDSIRIASPPH